MSTNIENTKKSYAAFSAGDIPTVLEHMATDCVWHVGGRSAIAGTYTGHDQILGYFGKLVELSGGTFAVELVDLAELPATGMVTALVNTTMTIDGTTTQVRMIELGRTNAQGQLAECWWFSEDQYALDAALAPATIVLPQETPVPTSV
ncbi:MAG: hypothetical protein NVS3B26_11420 [Mycobacteriales bacterium]